MSSSYRHTQRGTVIIVSMLSASVVLLVLGAALLKPLLIAAVVLLLGGFLFHSLTIEVTDSALRWHFGPGLIRKSVPLAELASAAAVRSNFWEGWGIHYSRFGWLYNVSGYDAVAVTLRDGRRFALGTDEPEKLLRALGFSPAGEGVRERR